MSITLKSLESTSDEVLCEAWKRAFVDYGMNASDSQLLAMFKRRGYKPEISFGAFNNDQIVSVALNGVGLYNNVLTAYDTSTGTVPIFRRQGLATQLFQHLLPVLKEKNIQQFILEVLKNNEAAQNLYMKVGFTIVREFYFFRRPVPEAQAHFQVLPPRSAEAYVVTVITGLPKAELIAEMFDSDPSWQNSHESLERKLLYNCHV